ncbi:glyoxal oxidase like protein [Thermothelomyces thermophilus ATCC 42464]|uniref:Glyoxal oxidase like protein n=1 Tax=Thermothelomyces thermophilus (strain ATCC 42464 / BCRC 31852 / DSM 1799) TaxID=573729 RepID=G2Q335_THET4|nr:glyoxal oxidase like protein [Thermothelomyces thermophilus ATCC 42464]AEO53498.1 glyoxal oxidase like protein [Thermothelomyces thermophilus ATCC 42464]
MRASPSSRTLLASLALSSLPLSFGQLSIPTDLPDSWEYQGCYTDVPGRTINSASYADGTNMTNAACLSYCASKGFPYAGTEYSVECFCGTTLASSSAKVADSECNMPCSGAPSEPCGAGSRLSLFHSSAVTGPAANPGVNDFTHLGCYAEGKTGRALTYNPGLPGADMTVAKCTAACRAANYILAGVEYGGECYCGNTIANGGAPADSGCSMVCNGNSTEFCGGPDRLNVYSYKNQYEPTATSTTGAGSTSSSSVPSATGLPEGWSYQGCWIDGKQGRILPYQLPDSQTNSRAACANACAEAGYTVSGTEYAVQCFCGDAIHNGGVETDEADCSTPCPGAPGEKCGAGDRLSIVSRGPPKIYAPPAPIEKIGDWEYQGCAEDNINDKRTFFWQIFFNDIMTPEMCLDRCAEFGYHAAGLEYGQECYCGDPANMATHGATFRPESECNVVCAGNSTAICGGLARLTTYFWIGTPFYSWDFPQDWRAGKYEFLVDGVNIPLITHETITGKVSFISKGATGPGNETGAYEFDPATLEFRELHIKTDVFCAASVTLPDKAGRQLNVGGWAGEATYGTRLYWPDGAPGVPGTHDWQENVNVLHLQAGRWYPSVLVLTNGSVMVVGGLIGSNDAATPSIEILPYTGTPPLYMDWLDRTHPNNLYPFLCILPGGGIFVQYWNEARILDPVTFDTVKTLPDAPGAPNDPKGGRTYPLEGTAVLLPQKYPYTDPLGVLICGGSTEGPGNALDNCVSIYPEADEPEWQIERMPSFRVMTCMAPLPDGTYLIANGALHGVAGFGLGVGPNLNALLYDPSKPLGSRITVAANTTIARMYHSEAITLLDGRVLISGSNPEDGVNPEEYRVEVFLPPYLLAGKPRPTFTLENRDWAHGQTGIPFTLGSPARNGDITATLLGSVASTHGNSMGARTLMPRVSCRGTSCTVDAPPTANICPPGWYQFFVLDGGIPAVGVYVRIGGDAGQIGNWPQAPDFSVPGV